MKVAKLQKIKIAEINQSCKIAKNENCKINYDMAFQHARPLRGSADYKLAPKKTRIMKTSNHDIMAS